jgi:hypothetical protein
MKASLVMKNNVRCTYLKVCYLGEAQECFGFKTDCPLYMKSNGEVCNEARFHAAMDRLIVRAKTRHDMIKQNSGMSEQPEGAPDKGAVKS